MIMKKIKHWHAILLAILLFLVVPLCINWAYTTPSSYSFFEMSWTAETALLFYGSSLAFVGTMFLGVVAIKQNNRITKIQERTLDKEESCYISIDKRKSGCDICLLENECETSYKTNAARELKFSVENFGEAFLEKIIIQMPTSTERTSYSTFIASTTIANSQFKNYSFKLPQNLAPNGLKVEFISNYGKSTFATFDIGNQGNHGGYQPKHYHFYGLRKPEYR